MVFVCLACRRSSTRPVTSCSPARATRACR
jgi:hypothetical protein